MFDNRYQNIDVLHIIGGLVAGGAERFVVDLIVQLKSCGLRPGLMVLSSRQDVAGQQMKKILKENNIPFLCGPTEKVALRSLIWFAKNLQEINPALVHLHTQNTEVAYYLSNKLSLKRRLLFRTIHNTNIPPEWLHWRAMRGNKVLASIACGDAVKGIFESSLGGKIITIQNGISFNWPIQLDIDKQKYLEALGLDSDLRHYLCIGHQNGESCETAAKGHDALIKAWRNAGLGDKGCVLHLLGDGNLHAGLVKLACGDASIVFHGIQRNIQDWLLAADYFLMPSRFEGLPIAAIEALGTGLPCIFSDIEPLSELGAPFALWASIDNVSELEDRLIESNELEPEISRTDIYSLRKKYGIEKTAKEYVQNYVSFGYRP